MKSQSKSFHLLLDSGSTYASCKFWSHLIYFEYLKLKTGNSKSNFVFQFCKEKFVSFKSKHLQFTKFEISQLFGKCFIKSDENKFYF